MKSNRLLMMLLVSLIIIGVVILINVISFSNIEEIVINQLKENQLTETGFAAKQIEDHILQVRDELVTLSKFPDIETLDINKCSGDMTIVHESIEGKISNILRVDKDGTVIECSSPIYSNYVGINIKNKEYFKAPKETNEPFIDNSIRQGFNRQIIVSAPLFETTEYTPYPNFLGQFKGVLLSIVEVNTLYDLYIHPIADPEKAFFLLINLKTEETTLKSNNIDEYSAIKNDVLSEKNLNIITDFNGFGETIITSSDIILGSETWRLIVLTPLKNVGKEISSVQNRHLFILGFVILVIIGGFIFLITVYQSREEVQSKLDKAQVTLEKLGIN
ncbi:MAG: cache domain-containing protein, partial [DPANN group archaeon]|nr:cache domain-containing protein [DPANN group archaeon]